jgi:hypothetical protein
MLKGDTLQAIENLLDSSEIPMNEYITKIDRDNGGHSLNICRKDKADISHMYLFSEIFNSYTEDWYVFLHDDHIHLMVK